MGRIASQTEGDWSKAIATVHGRYVTEGTRKGECIAPQEVERVGVGQFPIT
jgi:hypothetical protein